MEFICIFWEIHVLYMEPFHFERLYLPNIHAVFPQGPRTIHTVQYSRLMTININLLNYKTRYSLLFKYFGITCAATSPLRILVRSVWVHLPPPDHEASSRRSWLNRKSRSLFWVRLRMFHAKSLCLEINKNKKMHCNLWKLYKIESKMTKINRRLA